jgi:diguanylate cyclase (GGDEF)-like protein
VPRSHTRWWRDRSLLFKGGVVVALPLIALVASSSACLVAVLDLSKTNDVVDHNERVQNGEFTILGQLVDAETGVRGYLLTRDSRFLDPYHAAILSLPQDRSAFDALVRGDYDLPGRAAALSSLIDRRLVILRQALASSPGNRTAILESGKETMDEIRAQIASMDQVVAQRLSDAKQRAQSAVLAALLSAVGGLLLGILAGLIGIRTFVGGVVRGVRMNTDNAERLARGESLENPPDGDDEIGRSGRALISASERLAERERTIRENGDLLRLILQRISDGVVVADVEGNFLVFNEAAEEVLGLGALERDPSEWAASYGVMLPNGNPFPSEDLPLAKAIRGESVDAQDLIVRNPSKPDGLLISIMGRPLLDGLGRSRGGMVVFRDVTDERERERRLEAYRIELEDLNQELHEMATIDVLSGLPNRRGFEQLALQLAALAERRHEELSVVFMDLDGLKLVNDQLGHDVGSRMIVDAAQTIRAVARESDVVARIGGDEFCILLIGGAEVASLVVSRLRDHTARFNATTRRPYTLSISAGCASSTAANRSWLEDLIRAADALMYEDKRSRKAALSSAAGSLS